MKKVLSMISLFSLSIIFFSVSYAKATEAQLDQIVAVVNDDVITKSEFNHALSLIKLQISQQHMALPPVNVLHKQVLDQLINKRLQLQLAKQVGINVSDADLDAAIKRVATENNMTIKEVYQRINHDGMSTADYRNEMREQMTLQKLQQQEVVSRISISPEEVNHFMHSKVWQNNGSKSYHIEDILIPLSDTPSSEEIAAAKKHAEAVIAKLNQGQNFQTVAQSESGDKNALKGGDLGWLTLPEIPSAFTEHVARMQPKEIAGPIQTSNGFHIIRLAEERTTQKSQAAPDKKQIENLLLQRKFEEAVQNWVARIRSQAFINITKVS
jgi:peptidyl-prolyl cis-trans isomerase SurA